MRTLQSSTIENLEHEVERIGGDLAAVRSEIQQFNSSAEYRRGIIVAFRCKYHRRPVWQEFVKFWLRYTIRRSKCFRCFNPH